MKTSLFKLFFGNCPIVTKSCESNFTIAIFSTVHRYLPPICGNKMKDGYKQQTGRYQLFKFKGMLNMLFFLLS